VKYTLFGALRKSRFNEDLDAELEFHLNELAAANRAAGMSNEEAQHRARVQLGKAQQVRETCNEALWTAPVEDSMRDWFFAVRSLHKGSGLNLMTVLALALGIGCSTVIFSVVYNGVLHPFAYRSADRLVAIRIDDRHTGAGFRYEYQLDELGAFRKQNRSFEDIVGYGNWYMTYAREHRAEELHGGALTPNATDFFGMQPLLGRGFSEDDSQTGAPAVVLLNYNYWKKNFGGDRAVLGKQMMLDGRARTVIGVMPRRYQVLGADLWVPVSWNPNRAFEANEPHWFWATGRLKTGTKPETAVADLNVIAKDLVRLRPTEYPKQFTMVITSLGDAIIADFRRMLLVLAAGVAILLLLSCSNAGSLLLVRASARVKEMAVRAALGASRGRLIRQSFIETLVLGCAGCAAGCVIAFVALRIVSGVLTAHFTQLPWEASITLNWPTLVFAIVASLGSALLAGIAPAMYAGGERVQAQLGGTGVGVNASFVGSGFRSALVVCQVALSVVLVISAGVTFRQFAALTNQNLGLRVNNLFEGVIRFPRGKYETIQDKRKYVNEVLDRLSALPGVTNVAAAIGRPIDGGPVTDVTIEGKTHTSRWDTMVEACSDGYFSTLGLQLLHGRLLSTDDVAGSRFVAVINDTLARQYFGHEDPLGRQIQFKIFDELPGVPKHANFEVVGIVSDFKNRGVTETPMPEAFVPFSFTGFGDRGILVRTGMKPRAIQDATERILWDMDPSVVLGRVATLENFMNENVYAKPRFALITLGICAVIGLLLSVIGTFSVMAYSVSLRTHEIGVRLALGARRSAVLAFVFKRGMKLVGIGILLGFVAEVFFAPAARSLSEKGPSFDPLTAGASVAVLIAAGLLACYLPALRATRVDPNIALRVE